MNAHFANPWMLLFLWLIPGLALWWHVLNRRHTERMAAFVARPMLAKLFDGNRNKRTIWQIAVICTAIFLAIISIGRPKWGEKEETVYQQGRDLVIVLDVSRSMLAKDVHPNRLQRAKTDIMDLIKELRGDRAALIVFRAKSALVCPLTTDYSFLQQALDTADVNSAPRGETDIGNAIAKALNTFDTDGTAHKAIILISDGEDLRGKGLDMAEKAGKDGIAIFTVGLGSSLGSKIPNPDKTGNFISYKDSDVLTKLNHTNLLAIAKSSSGGAYIPVETASMTGTTLGSIYRDHLRNINAREMAETQQRRAIERYQWFLFPAICLLLAGAFLSRGRLAKAKPHIKTDVEITNSTETPTLKNHTPPPTELKQLAVFIIFSLSLCLSASSQVTNDDIPGALELPDDSITTSPPEDTPPGRYGARKAQNLFKKGQYADSADIYLKAARGETRSANRNFRHNAAVAYFKTGDFDKAADILRDLSLQARRGESKEAMGLGTVLFRSIAPLDSEEPATIIKKAQLLKESGEAFKEAWRAENDNLAARDNLSVVIKTLPEIEEDAKIAKLMSEHEKTPPQLLADTILSSQRLLIENISSTLSNTTSSLVRELEGLAAQQQSTADLWIPLKAKLVEAMAQNPVNTNIQNQAALSQIVDMTRSQMTDTSLQLRDLDSGGLLGAQRSEQGIYAIWKNIVPYPMLLKEDMLRQTNSINMTKARNAGKNISKNDIAREQLEATELTDMFIIRFTNAVPVIPNKPENAFPTNQPGVPPLTIGTNETSAAAPKGISPEDRKRIIELAESAAVSQRSISELINNDNLVSAINEQNKVLNQLTEIEELLPKEENKQQQNQEQNDQKEDQKQEQQQQNQNQEKKEQSQEKKEEPQKQENEDIQKMLQKALEREREHEAEKRRRNMTIPLPPSERDW